MKEIKVESEITEEIKQLATDVNNVAIAVSEPLQNEIRLLRLKVAAQEKKIIAQAAYIEELEQ